MTIPYIIPRRMRCAIAAIPALLLLFGCAPAPPETEVPARVEADAPSAEEIIVEAEARARNDQLDEAASMLEELVERERTNTTALRLLANVYSALGLREQSTETWARIALIEPYDPDAAYETALADARRGDWTGVRSKIIALETAGKAEGRHFLLIGEADLELGQKGEAKVYLAKAKGETRARYLLGTIYYGEGKYGRAEEEFAAVLRSDPDNPSAHLHMGWLAYRNGEHREALRHYREAVRLNPGDALPALSLAGLLEEMKRHGEAIEQYRDALSLPGIPPEEKRKAYNSFSRLLVEESRLAEAEQVIAEGLEEFPNSGGLYYQWGMLLLERGDRAGAVEKLKAAARDPVWKEPALRRMSSIR
ncbi:MAG TPA: tetratricopeptide repeat protein [Candidatus Eisenbacteria bacterium]|uniref:Tetratricopeptide repeat protein n=1 Tax=Eiseniibacteriota bacterium TaxID=2212470 RepID=A0A7V2AVU8_UNCEI|nr:tetratricopeptide repeat protein [Candidatus Eisenbacteria bacterium]